MKKYLFVGALLTLLVGGCVKSSLKEPVLYTNTTLETKDKGKISISNEYGSWKDENIISRVSSGTAATIIEIKEENLKDGTDEGQRFMRLKVRMVKEPFTEGWVHSYDAGYPMPKFEE
jgi:hypothetical protein